MTARRKVQGKSKKAQPQTTTVTLTAVVTMAGVAHDAGKTVTIAKDTADWLIEHGKAQHHEQGAGQAALVDKG